MKKIIHIALGKANPNRMNGVNQVVHQLAIHQQALGIPVNIWGIANDLQHNYPERPVKTALYQQDKHHLKIDAKILADVQKQTKDTFFHIHGAFIPEFYRISKRLQQLNMRYAYTPHGAFSPKAFQKGYWKKWLYFNFFEKNILQKAQLVQLLGKDEAEYLPKLLFSDNQALIPNGQVLPTTIIDANTRFKDGPVFGFCGRIDLYHKGLDLFMTAFQEYRAEGGKGYFELIGNGRDFEELQKRSENLIQQGVVTFHDKQFGEQKWNLLKKFNIFIHTSRMEGFPMAVLEAASLGLPCLTSPETNINDHIRQYKAGFPLEKNTINDIKEAIFQAEKAWQEGQLLAKGKAARQLVETHFSWQEIAKKLLEYYEK